MSDDLYETFKKLDELDEAPPYQRGKTQDWDDTILDRQEGVCAICGCAPSNKRNGRKSNGARRFHRDHDHLTNKLRGLLCLSCNTGLGRFGDNVAWLKNALGYLLERDSL